MIIHCYLRMLFANSDATTSSFVCECVGKIDWLWRFGLYLWLYVFFIPFVVLRVFFSPEKALKLLPAGSSIFKLFYIYQSYGRML